MPPSTATMFAILLAFSSLLVLAAHGRLSNVDSGLQASRGVYRRSADLEDLTLSDTVLVASIDGKFHALNRTTGQIKWSMHKPISPSGDTLPEPPLHNLVRSVHSNRDDTDEDEDEVDLDETYIIEPQSGEVFVLPPGASQTTPLEKLPFTVPQLVDLSPFRLQVGHEQRMFLGRKETSLITLDIDTGTVISIHGANMDNSCIWDAANTTTTTEGDEEEEEDLSQIEDSISFTRPRRRSLKPRRAVLVGRTDYHVSVHVDGKGIVQTLTFSVYGPNNVDRDRQERWIKPVDGRYLQPMPDGHIFSLRPQKGEYNPLEWIIPLPRPAVAIFDIVYSTSESSPILLHQPRATLVDLFPGPQHRKERSLLKEGTYVGIIGDSLFAMSHANFPLVNSGRLVRRGRSGPGDVALPENEECSAHGCLVGTYASGDSASSRFSRLIEGREEKLLIEGTDPTIRAMGEAVNSAPKIAIVPSLPYDGHYGWSSQNISAAILGVCTLIAYISYLLLRVSRAPRSTAIPVPELLVEKSSNDPISSSTLAIPTADSVNLAADDADGSDQEADAENNGDDMKPKKSRTRRRGRKKKGEALGLESGSNGVAVALPHATSSGEDFVVVPEPQKLPPPSLSLPPAPPSLAVSLTVSDTILGYGSSGTVVYQGSFQGRAVAVKRLLQDFVTVAAREVALLQESDDHPNVIRYFYQEQKDNFLYIALELCPASLEDILHRPNLFPEITSVFQPKRGIAQITAGLRHLHSLKIVHRDIKPQNILVSQAKNGAHRLLISDFGLCKKLAHDETSFLPTRHGPLGAGTVGWRAPEILRGEVDLDVSAMESINSIGGQGDSTIGSNAGSNSTAGKSGRTRLTTSVDIFALGCLTFYTLTGGEHPYGGPFERESNILKDDKDLEWLQKLGEEGEEARDLIEKMLHPEPRQRLSTAECLVHPFFWTTAKRLGFLQDASDRFEIMERDPPEKGLVALETGAYDVVGVDWSRRLDKVFMDNLGKYRKYNGRSIQDLLRALRNKKHHYQDLPDNVKRHLGALPEGFLSYFTRRFPRLFLHVYYTIAASHQLRHDSLFKPYFEAPPDI